jgi:hypothetical protein
MGQIYLPDDKPPTGEGLTYEKVWAAMQETNRRMQAASDAVWEQFRATDLRLDKRAAEFDQELSKRAAEFDQQQKETDRQLKETDRQLDKRFSELDRQLNKRFGELTNRFGEIVEYSVVPNLVSKFRELNFEFTKAHRDTQIVDRENDIITEVDAFLENGDKVMIVEIKTKLSIREVDDHIERMGKLRKYADLRNDTRIYLGAVAGAVLSENVRVYALKNGFYVIEPSGDSFDIIVPQGNAPREW